MINDHMRIFSWPVFFSSRGDVNPMLGDFFQFAAIKCGNPKGDAAIAHKKYCRIAFSRIQGGFNS